MSRKDFRVIGETIRLLPSFETHQQDGKLYPCEVLEKCSLRILQRVVVMFGRIRADYKLHPAHNVHRFEQFAPK